MAYAISACGGSGSGANVYSDEGTYEASVDSDGNAVPLILTSDSEGRATVTSLSSGNVYTVQTVDLDGNPVGDITLGFL
ncbi:MAG: hypothetical protein C0603_11660 [Denitrovibrio sp.]|nr:MAG: hypothetical protein C0603_11660 [Denitrovibrio sp.]